MHLLGKEDRPMAIRLKVDSNLAVLRLVMQVLHSSGHAEGVHVEDISHINSRTAVCVRGLYNGNLNVTQLRGEQHLLEVLGYQDGDLVTIQHVELAIDTVLVVVDYSVGVPIKGSKPLVLLQLDRLGRTLVHLLNVIKQSNKGKYKCCIVYITIKNQIQL